MGNLERKSKGRFDWNYFDRRLLEMARANYGIVGMLLTTPEWARVGDCAARLARYASAGVRLQNYWCPPANPQDFADYVRATVERYDGDGSNDAPGSPRVAVWQLWNEPNAWETWPGSPEEYGGLLAASYAAAKAADPSAVVVTGGVYMLLLCISLLCSVSYGSMNHCYFALGCTLRSPMSAPYWRHSV